MRDRAVAVSARAGAAIVALAWPLAARAQPSATLDGPPPPVPPAVISRNAAGQATVRAIRLTSPLKVDGQLDDDVYTREQPFGGLIQVTPRYGEPMTERSDIWITYDDRNIYVTCRCWDSAPPDQWIANELRRDTNGLRQNDHIGVMFDTFYDRRSGFAFYTNPLGARADYSVVDEGGSNTDWNPVWTSRTGRFDGGWTVEMAIPFKSIRYRAGANQVWGVQLRRSVRRKNEWAYLTPVPQILAGPQALNRISSAGTLVGLDLPTAGRNIELKPYAVSRLTTDRLRTPPVSDEPDADIGGDVKFSITPNLTADFTANTDFAQVEIDEQQVNLTRFSLFYPEKRDFFLEGRGIFDFARGGTGASGGFGTTDTPYLFYTRRVGLNSGRVIPINAGGRLTGKLGPYAIGMMNIQAGAEPVSQTDATNFTVVRLKRDVLRRSAIGAMATSRSVSATGPGSNQAYGVDGTFSFFQNLSLGAYWARTTSTAVRGGDQSYQGRFDYNADRYGARTEFLSVGRNFRPDVGFTRRTDFRRSFAELRFSPRPARSRTVRKYTWSASGEYIANGAGSVDSRVWEGHFGTEFHRSDQISIDVTHDYEALRQPFTPAGSPTAIAPGGYTFTDVAASYTFGAQRRVSGAIAVRVGDYYNGTIRSVTIGPGTMSPGRVSVSSHLSVEPTFSLTRIELPDAAFTTRLARARVDYAFSPLMFASGLVQYSSADRALSTNLRFRWEYAPGSELFLVYTEERDRTDEQLTTPTLVRGLKNRALVVKINRLLRF
ncbi:MAG TPA: DUF5916 domain-containing protein [Gemmatimonadaceae bacterium]|nr:DUF5916 domain-containing protein [Gemmatimonadaceae bacterium]